MMLCSWLYLKLYQERVKMARKLRKENKVLIQYFENIKKGIAKIIEDIKHADTADLLDIVNNAMTEDSIEGTDKIQDFLQKLENKRTSKIRCPECGGRVVFMHTSCISNDPEHKVYKCITYSNEHDEIRIPVKSEDK